MDLQIVYLEPAKVILAKISSIFVSLAAVVLVLLVGWIIAKIVKSILAKALKAIKVDELAEKINLNNLLLKGGINIAASELIAMIGYWIIIFVALFVAADAAGLKQAASLLDKVILYVPNIVAAIFVLLLGMFAATILSSVVKTASANAGVEQGSLFGRIVQITIIAFAVAIALEQLKIATLTIHSTVSIIIAVILGSLGLGIALAFGLGCKDLVAKYVEDFIDKVKSKK
ncbi:MAG: hypothetical protein M0R48_09120 [Candidatus Omnitrophica bacterium]|jgi:hypothetical protein|nr:hypothetical protein [Candidatus Omnitrophota bacterium]